MVLGNLRATAPPTILEINGLQVSSGYTNRIIYGKVETLFLRHGRTAGETCLLLLVLASG
jgi:hypothetical protein